MLDNTGHNANLNSSYISPEDYLEGEKISPIKHEYIRGEVYGMAGASKAHGIIALNFATRLKNHLKGSGCTPYVTDIKVRTDYCQWFHSVSFNSDLAPFSIRGRASITRQWLKPLSHSLSRLKPTIANGFIQSVLTDFSY